MFNVTVLKMKDIKKYLLGMIITTVVIILVSKYSPKFISEKKIMPKILTENNMICCLEQTIPVMSIVNKEYQKIEGEKSKIEEQNLLQEILKTQVSSIQRIETVTEISEEKEKQEENREDEKQDETQIVEVAQTDLETQVITDNPIKESYNAEYGNVKIKNETDYELTRRNVNTRYYYRKQKYYIISYS